MLDYDWLSTFLACPDLHPNRTGQAPFPGGEPEFGGRFNGVDYTPQPSDLGFGWIYYALVQLYRPKTVVCIGSGRGFAPILMAKGLCDQGCGRLDFIDPSLDDDFWKDPDRTYSWFDRFGVAERIRHHLTKTEEFVLTQEYAELPPVDMLLVDGRHYYENVLFDFNAFKVKLASAAIVLFHDSVSRSRNPAWWGPRKLLLELEQSQEYQTFDFALGAGLTLFQKRPETATRHYLEQLKLNWGGDAEAF